MGLLDDIQQKIQDFTSGGAVEDLKNGAEDLTNNLGDVGSQIQDVLPGQDNEEEQK